MMIKKCKTNDTKWTDTANFIGAVPTLSNSKKFGSPTPRSSHFQVHASKKLSDRFYVNWSANSRKHEGKGENFVLTDSLICC